MNEHLPTDQRRRQIASVALDLLAQQPVAALSTRQIAERVGVSQPALFRHFASREAILLAVLDQARADLGDLLERQLRLGRPAAQTMEEFVQGLGEYVSAHPGLPRLLFADVAEGSAPAVHAAVLAMQSRQQAVMRTLLELRLRDERPAAGVDLDAAAALWVALLQGTILQWQITDRAQSLPAALGRALGLWWAGLEAVPLASAPPQPQDAPALQPLHVLDVRPILASGTDPLHSILEHLGRLPPGGVLKVIAPFRPKPLLALLAGRGHAVRDRDEGGGVFHVEIPAVNCRPIEDLRDLEAPLPLERVLTTAQQLGPGQSQVFRVPRLPLLVLPHLAARGVDHCTWQESDGSALLWIGRSP
ncbi:MAG: DUF2249 domain-containing protein [Deltaproteobacteria bacterium]|nr:DUF2249 domain-containing protein [Deltaproteobacteria bacterium]